MTSSGSEKSKIFGIVKFERPSAASKKFNKILIAGESIERDVFNRKSYSATYGAEEGFYILVIFLLLPRFSKSKNHIIFLNKHAYLRSKNKNKPSTSHKKRLTE